MTEIKRILFTTTSDENNPIANNSLLQNLQNETNFQVSSIIVPAKINLCQSLAQGMFERADFVFPLTILKIDNQFDLKGFVNQKYDLFAIASESKIGNNGRWSEHSLFFDGRFFGGTFKAVGEICQQIANLSIDFSKTFDAIMKERTKNLKGKVLIKIVKPSKGYQRNQFYQIDHKQPLDFELPEDDDLEGQRIDWELQVDRQRQTKQNQFVDQIVEKLEQNYRSKLSNFQKVVFETFLNFIVLIFFLFSSSLSSTSVVKVVRKGSIWKI